MQSFQQYKQINEQIDYMLSEGRTLEQIKQTILDWIQGADEEQLGILNDIYTRINKRAIRTPLENIISDRSLPSEDEETLLNIISKPQTELEDKKNLTQMIKDKTNLISADSVLNSQGKTSFEQITPSELAKNETFQSIKNEILNLKATSGGKERGKGEIFATLFIENTQADMKDLGDIVIDGQHVEVKGSGARMRGQKGFNAGKNNDVKEGLISKLRSFSGDGSISMNNSLSFKNSKEGIKLWNEKLKGVDSNKVKEMFAEAFKKLYPQISDNMMRPYLDTMVNNDGTVDSQAEFAVAAMNLDYYKSIEGFDMIMLVSPSEGEFITIQDGQDFLDNANSLKITGFIDWASEETRNSVPKIALR